MMCGEGLGWGRNDLLRMTGKESATGTSGGRFQTVGLPEDKVPGARRGLAKLMYGEHRGWRSKPACRVF